MEKQDYPVSQKAVGTAADPTPEYLQFTAQLRNAHLETHNPQPATLTKGLKVKISETVGK